MDGTGENESLSIYLIYQCNHQPFGQSNSNEENFTTNT